MLPERWDTIQKSSVVSTLPDAPVATQEGVNPWGATAAPTPTPEHITPRQDTRDVPTDPISFDASATHPDMTQPTSTHGGLKIAIAAIFALGVLLCGGALMLIALKNDRERPSITQPPHIETVQKKPVVDTPQPPPRDEAVPTPQLIINDPIEPATVALQPKQPPPIDDIKPTEKSAPRHEPFDLLDPTDTDAKLAYGHAAIASIYTIEPTHIALLMRLDDLGDERAHEAASYFSDVSSAYYLAAKNLEDLAGHAPSSSSMDGHAMKLARIVRNIAELFKKSYAYRMDSGTPHTGEEVRAFITQKTLLMDKYRPAYDAFMLALLEQEHAMLKKRYDATSSKSGPLMHHYHGVMLSLARAMESTARYGHTQKSGPYVRRLTQHATSLDKIDLSSFKEELDSAPRQSVHDCALAAKRASGEFAEYQKALKKYEKSTKLTHQHKLATARADLHLRYNFAMKKYTRRPGL